MKSLFITTVFLLFFKVSWACSIFSCARNGEILVGSNEDGDYPFSFVRTIPSTEESYGAIFFGAVDMQAQSGVNEHGLFFDFTYLPKGEVDPSFLKESAEPCLNSISDLVLRCKNVPELLDKLKEHPFNILTSQLFIADANGEMAIINVEEIIRQKKGYLIATNFNICKAKEGDYSCNRYDKIEAALNQNGDISINKFQKILNEVHVEGEIATQYSNVYDLKRGKIYMNLYHNYEETVEIDVQEQINKGFSIIPLESFFKHKNFITNSTLKSNSDYYRLAMTERFYNEGFEEGLIYFNELLKSQPIKADDLKNSLSLVPFTITAFERAIAKNKPFFLYYNPDYHYCETYWTSETGKMEIAKSLMDYLSNEGIIKKDFRYYEDLAYIYMTLGKNHKAVEFYKNALDVAGNEDKWRVERVRNMLKILA